MKAAGFLTVTASSDLASMRRMSAAKSQDSPPGRYQTEIGGRIRLLREAMGKTRVQMAELMGTNENNLKEIEHGRQFPNPEFVRRLCTTNLVDFNWLYSGHGRLDPEVEHKIAIIRRNRRKPESRVISQKQSIKDQSDH